MYKIAVMGQKDSVMGFMALGLDVFPTTSDTDVKKMFHHVAREYAVIYITEQLSGELSEDILKYAESPLPAIILIPGSEGSLGIGTSSVKKSVEKAVGADILFNK